MIKTNCIQRMIYLCVEIVFYIFVMSCASSSSHHDHKFSGPTSTTSSIRMLSQGSLYGFDGSHQKLLWSEEKTVVVMLWASWCHACHQTMPQMRELAIRYKNKIQLIAVSVDENPLAAAAMVREYGRFIPMYWDGDAQWKEAFSVESLPMILWFDAQGTLLWHRIGFDTVTMMELDRALNAL